MKRMLALLLVTGVAACGGLAQQLPPAEADLFGDNLVKPLPPKNEGVKVAEAGPVTAPDVKLAPAGLAHGLIFQDGRTLRGELVSLTKTEIVWRRPDVDKTLRFSLGEIRRIFLREPGMVEPNAGALVPATVKLAGTDWLNGDLRSADGKKFTLQLRPGVALDIPREAAEWLYFNKTPMAAPGVSSDPLSLENWQFENLADRPESVDGTLQVRASGSVERRLTGLPARFELEIVVPATTRHLSFALWPAAPTVRVEDILSLHIYPKQIIRQVDANGFEEKVAKLPDGPSPPNGLRTFQMFFDLPANKFSVFYNGQPVEDLNVLREAGKEPFQLDRLGVLCFNPGQYSSIQLQRARLRPWNGVLPKAGEAAETTDVLSAGPQEVRRGTLQAVTEKEITLGGEARPRADDTFLRFPREPAAFPGGEALLGFGAQGELTVGDLEVAGGRLKCRSSLGPAMDLPLDGVAAMAFRRAPDAAPKPAPPPLDIMVFRNGDSLPGTLVTTASGQPLRWRTVGGEEVSFEATRIAGIRLAERVAAPSGSQIVELRNGDRLGGKVRGLDDKSLRLTHSLLGEITLGHARLWRLLLDPRPPVIDAGSDPINRGGMEFRKRNPDQTELFQRLDVCLDGTFLETGRSDWHTVFRHDFTPVPERYEIRAEVMTLNGNEPSLSVNLAALEIKQRLMVWVRSGHLEFEGFNSRGPRETPPRSKRTKRKVPLDSKVPAITNRRTLRLFVDTKPGTVDCLVDGVHVAKFGHDNQERIPGIGARLCNVNVSLSSRVSTVCSNLWLGPWNGELPRPGAEPGGVTLTNGDVAPGAPRGGKDGKIVVDSDAGGLELPLDRITSVQFAGVPAPEKSAARLRLRNGDIVHVEDYRWENGELRARSAAIGEIKLPATEVSELILAPHPIRFPRVIEGKTPSGNEPNGAPRCL